MEEAAAKKGNKRMQKANPEVAKKKSRNNGGEQVAMAQAANVENSTAVPRVPSKNNVDTANSIQRERDQVVSQIQRQADWLAAATVDEMGVEVLQTRLDILNRAWERFEKKERALLQAARPELQRADDFVGQQAVEDVYVGVRAELSKRIKALERSCNATTCTPANSRALQYQFAELPLADRLPTFDGSHREWIQFRDIFTAEVLHHPHLTDLQRLRRLQSCVKGGAARALGDWPQRDDSLPDAWRTLCLAYDNEYLCHAAHCSAIYNLPCWPKATHALIRNMLDVTRNSMRMIARQLSAEEQRDLFILNFLESRLDNVSRTQWEMSRPTDRIPNLQGDFFTWLERRGSGLLSHATHPIIYHRDNPSNNPRAISRMGANVAASLNYRPCLSCAGDHAVHRCPALERLNREQKIKRIIELGLCQNCLRKGHIAKNCLSSRCPRCARAPHNSIICPKLTAISKKDTPQTSVSTILEEDEDPAL